jgi:nucleoside 2-deoxyribosyltransferase
MMPQPKVYLAGPDVFHRDAIEIGRRKKSLCSEYGMIGLFPFDNEIANDSLDISSEIYAANVAMIREADCAIVNLTPFRGPSADVGTVFELGMLIALGKDVYAYSNAAGSLLERIRREGGVRFDQETNSWRDEDDMSVENFGNADNLMIDASLKSLGRCIHRRDVPAPQLFSDLEGFIACLAEAKAVFTKTTTNEPYAA